MCAGETTEGTGTHQTGASMGPYSGAEEEQHDTPKQASTEQPAAQDRAEASSKPAQQNAEAGSSEPALPAKGPGRPGHKEEPVVHREVEPAIHSNSEEQGPHHRAGSMPGISSKDEAQVSTTCWRGVEINSCWRQGRVIFLSEGCPPLIYTMTAITVSSAPSVLC